MSRSFGVINLAAFIFLSALIYAFINYMHNENNEFEQLRLSYEIDYASDAGTAAMLNTGDLGADYSNAKSISLDPNLALDTFLTVFCFGYDMIPNAENKQLVKQYIPAIGVATFDGYYIATQRLIKNGVGNYPEGPAGNVDYDLTFGPKLPYTYSFGGGKYALNMGMDYAYLLSGSNLTKFMGMPPTTVGSLTQQDIWHIINKEISDDMAYTIDQFNVSNPNWSHQFYVPDTLTNISGVNPIKGPTFMVLVQGLDFTTSRKISGFSIAGSKIDNARMLAAYVRNGINYYCYVDKMPVGMTVIDLYSSMKDAALAGYYADQQYMQ